jgi:hypothetical protein
MPTRDKEHTEESARTLLSGKLVFGDAEQIKAVDFLAKLEDADERFKNCQCEEYCDCLLSFSDAVIRALRKRYKHSVYKNALAARTVRY